MSIKTEWFQWSTPPDPDHYIVIMYKEDDLYFVESAHYNHDDHVWCAEGYDQPVENPVAWCSIKDVCNWIEEQE